MIINNQNNNKKCEFCKNIKSNLLKCSRCKKVYYCNQEHQKLDWLIHKKNCKNDNNYSNKIIIENNKNLKNNRYIDKNEFSNLLPYYEFIPSYDGILENLIIFFHGLGDNEKSYIKLAKQMKLPQTSYLIFRAPITLPFIEESYCWIPSIDENTLEYFTFSIKRLEGLYKIRLVFYQILHLLETKFNWNTKRIFFIGFSQGGTLALDIALHYSKPIGGVIGISASLLDEYISISKEFFSSFSPELPILITHGLKDKRIPIEIAKEKFQFLQNKIGPKSNKLQWKEYNKEHQMIASQEEMKDIFLFLSNYLYLRNTELENRSDILEIKQLDKNKILLK